MQIICLVLSKGLFYIKSKEFLMNNTADFNELKSILSETLQYFELSDSLIDQLLSDNFINGLLELQQQEPVNNSFISMLRNFSDEQNLCTAKEFEEELHSELCKDGYVKSVFQYINNSWLDIPFPGEIQTRSNNSIVENAKRGISIVGAALSTLAKRFNIACTNFAGNLNQYISIAQRLNKRINDDYAIAQQFDENLRAVALGIRYNTKTGENTRSPLIVDLDGDGVETTTAENGTHFDHDNNGFAEKTSWVGKDDGLLVRDINGNGQIDDGTELFGNNSVLSNGQKAANGFEALKDLDSNNDGIFDSSDTAWNQVNVWKDSNLNGKVDEGELLTLEQAGIENIDLNYQNSNTVDTNGNTVGQIGSFDKENGTQGNISDIWFNTDLMDTVDKTNIDIPADIAALPNVTGFGNVHDLHTAMALDTSGELKALVQQYAAETDSEARQQILYNIIYHWTGVQDEPIDGRDPTQVYGKVIDDTRKLEALEEFMGEEYLGTWCWGERDPNPHGKAAPYILRAFDILAEYIDNELLAQTHYKPLLENVKLTWDNTTETWSVDVSGAVAQIQSLYNENAENGIITFREFEKLVKNCGYSELQSIYEAFRTYGSLTGSDLDIMFAKFGYTYGTDLNDDLTGTSGVDEINGLAGNDSIYGGAGNDTLDGGTGNDNIFGEDGDDILIGGEGNDYLIGGNGADTYIFNPGFGNDAIDNSDDNASASEPDIIQFGEGILASKTTLGRQGYDLIITVSYDPDENGTTRPNDSIRVYSYFDQQGTSSATVNSIVFADGTTWDYEYVRDHWNSIPDANGGETLEGNNENNTINGTNYNDILIGNGGNDTINAGNGNDRLLGGTGNDTLNGGSGDDTYLWNWGDGMDTISDTGNHDKISFGDGITYSDLKFRQEGGNLRITVKNNENQGMLINGFFSSLDYKIEDLYFQDGSIVHLSEIPLTLHQLNTDETINLTGNGDTVYANGGDDRVNGGQGNDTIFGGDGNDNIYGNSGNDVISGGKGDDTIDGGNGADTYIWNLGDGLDTIAQVSSEDIIKFGPGITFDNLSFRNDNGDLRIYVNGDDTQGIICKSFFNNDNYKSKQILFNDGTSFPLPTSPLTLTQKNTSETVTATIYNDTIYANGGADTVHSGQGDDVIYGGAGFDSLYGEDGNDTLIGGTGSDYLEGGAGDDTYIYNVGDGLDTIWDYQSSTTESRADKIKFGEGISFKDLTFRRENSNLVITLFNDCTQGIIIKEHFYDDNRRVEYLEFADGTTKNLTEMAFTFQQTDAHDNVSGTNYDDTIYGNGGNDTIYGNDGDDVLAGGTGNDHIEGGAGNDTYIWNLGDGFDTFSDYQNSTTESRADKVKFGEGISFDDLTFERSGNHLNIYVKGDRNQGVQLYNQFYDDYRRIEYLEFVDGTTKNLTEIGFTYTLSDSDDNVTGTNYNDIIYGNGGNDTISTGNGDDTLYGGTGNDTLNGENGNDILIGGKGNDQINGGAGDDTYIYNLGDGFDTISESAGTDKVILGEGISLENLTFERSGNHLNVYINNDKTQGIQLYNQFYDSNHMVETLEFADGSTFDLTKGLTFNQHNGAETVNGTNYDDIIYGNGGDDIIEANDGNDTVYGGTGNDTIRGHNGNDTIEGGLGNDALDGGNGDDTYIYSLGDGFDTIYDASGSDKIKFGAGIEFDDLTFRVDGGNLYMFINGDEKQGIMIYNMITNGSYNIETLEFADGSTKQLSEMGLTLQQHNGSETITGTNYDDIIYGNGGNDTLYGGNGNDILSGGTGHDRLEGGSGDDTYVWNLNDGIDTISDYQGTNKIKFGADITQAELSFAQVGNNLRIIVNNDPSQGLIIENYYNNDGYKIGTIEFADGSEVSVADLIGNLVSLPDQVIEGSADDDILTGGNGNDTINAGDGYNDITGGKGNDTLNGGYDKDTYYYNLGDGYDVISDPYGRDKIIFGEGISQSDLIFQKDGSDLFISIKGRDNDGIRIFRHFYDDNYKIEQLEFADGSTMNLSKGTITLHGTDNNDSISGTTNDEIIYGGSGNDTINGEGGVDIIYGGKGNDTINGGVGEDTIVWNLGDDLDTVTFSDIDHLKFGEGITFEDLTFYAEGNNLRIVVKGDMTQGIICNNYYYGNDYRPENIIFADGSIFPIQNSGLVIHHDDRSERILGTDYADTIYGGKGNDDISGGNGNDIIYGKDGNDTISGGNGTDIIIGGKGNDTINGDGDADTFIWNLGDDLDTITASNIDKLQFGEGITLENLSFRCEGNNLRIIVNNDETQGIVLVNFFYGSSYMLNDIKFADGSIFNLVSSGLTFDQHVSVGDTITGTPSDDIINAQNTYSVTINAGDGSDSINAGEGNDTINAGLGNDIIYGNKGNDTLNGGDGDDTYLYNLGDGFDTINDSLGYDKVIFGTGISLENLSFRQYNNSLIITINDDPKQGFEIVNYYNGSSNQIEELQFSDGTTKLLTQLDITLVQGEHSETINGTDSNETIYGNGGNDTINGNYGNDILIGGTGNDTLNGGGDNDTYVYNLGDGLDTITDDAGSNKIIFGEGITQNNLTFTQMGNNLLIYLNGDKNQGIMINNFFYNDSYKIGEIHFADNSVFYLSETGLTLDQSDRTDNMTINGTDYDDTIIGGFGNDTINAGDDDDVITGGKGNDTLNGGYGRDTYIYNLGDGIDTISETRGNDKIKFGTGIALDDLKFTQEGNDLRITINDDVSQSILIDDFYRGTNYQVETLQFADGAIFNLSTQGLTLQQTNANETVNGTSYNDVIYGNGGHDTINAGEGNDTLIGGIGNDYLNGGNGDDTYIYNLGDGFDTITEAGGNDKIVFGEGISQSDLSFEKIGNNLKISINGDEIKGIQINDHFRYDSSKVETIEFHDGSTLDISNADQLIQAMNSFSISNSASTDTLSNPTQDVSDMYSLAASQDLTRKAI